MVCFPLLFVSLIFYCCLMVESESEASSSFLWLSDIHLDPYYGQPQAVNHFQACAQNSSNNVWPFGQVGCDSPTLLIEETLREASIRTKNQTVDFILLTGDLCRHGNDELPDPITSTGSILRKVIDRIRAHFPGVDIIPTPGNNDFTPDYYLDLSNVATNSQLEMISNAFNTTLTTDEEETMFRRGARLARNTTGNLTILSINTIGYSMHHEPAEQVSIDDPLGQLQWLRDQLEQAKATGRFVYIVGHIPPTIGSYRRSQLWHEKYLTQYYTILSDYTPGVVQGQLFGHLHTDEFRLVSPLDNDDTRFNIFMSSSVTPIYGSNPSFRLAHYDPKSAILLDYDTFYLNLSNTVNFAGRPSWTQTRSFQQAYRVSDMSLSSIESIVQKLEQKDDSNSEGMWNVFLSRQSVFSISSNVFDCDDDYCAEEWLCTLTATTEQQYASCVYPKWINAPSSLVKKALVVAIIFTSMLLLVALWKLKLKRLWKRRHYSVPDDNNHGASEIDLQQSHATSNSLTISSDDTDGGEGQLSEGLPEIS